MSAQYAAKLISLTHCWLTSFTCIPVCRCFRNGCEKINYAMYCGGQWRNLRMWTNEDLKNRYTIIVSLVPLLLLLITTSNEHPGGFGKIILNKSQHGNVFDENSYRKLSKRANDILDEGLYGLYYKKLVCWLYNLL